MQPQQVVPPIRDLRVLLQARDKLPKYSNGSPVNFCDLTRDLRYKYIRQRGLRRYLADMLSHFAGKPAAQCTAYYEANTPIRGTQEGRLIDFLVNLTNKHPSKMPPMQVVIQDIGKTHTFSI